MVRTYKTRSLGRTYRELLEHLGKGSPTAIILQELSLKYDNYYRRVKHLEKHRYVTIKRTGKILNFELQPKAIKLLSRGVEKVKSKKKISLHDFWVSYKILRKPTGFEPEKILTANSIDFNTNNINNWRGIYFDYASVKVRVTPNKIMFCPPEIELEWNDSPDHAKNQALKYVDNILPKIESLFNVSLSKPDKVSVSVSSQHIAFVNNEFAKYFTDRDISLNIYDEHGKKRVIVDKSKGYPELEFIHKAHAEDDSERMKDFIDEVESGRFNTKDVLQIVKGIADNQLNLSNDLVEYGRQISLHTDSIGKLGEGVEKLTNLIEQLENNKRPYPFFSSIKKRFKK